MLTERRASLLAGIAVTAFACLIVVLHVSDYTKMSPYDELQHYDYLVRVMHDGDIVRRGDHFGQEALRTEACQGLDVPGYAIPPCGRITYEPTDFQERGINTAYIHPPVYYAISGSIAAGLSWIVGSDSLFTTGRLSGVVWMAGAMILTWLAMAELGITWTKRTVALLFVATAPVVMETTATINPDATALFAGAAVLFAVLRWERGGRWWPAALTAAFAVALKSTNIVALGLGVLYLLIRQVQQGRETRWGTVDRAALRRILLVLASMVAGAGVVALVWVAYSASVARVPTLEIPMAAQFHVDSLSIRQLLSNLDSGITALNTPYVPAEVHTAWIDQISILVDRFFLVGVGIAAFASPVGSRMRALGIAAIVACFAVGPTFVLANFVLQGTYVGIPRRYGLSIVPALAVALTVVLSHRRVLQLAGVVVAGISLATVHVLLG
jgi:hypothetical protein